MSTNDRIPPSAYKAEYPHNKCTVTPSGHCIEYDDTPGAERIAISHGPSGTYSEIGPDGTLTTFTTGNSHHYNKCGLSMTTDHNCDIKIHGHQRVCIGGGSHLEVAGDANIVVAGDCLSAVAGNMKAAVAGAGQFSIGGSASMKVEGNFDMKVGGSTTMTSDGDHIIKAANIRLN